MIEIRLEQTPPDPSFAAFLVFKDREYRIGGWMHTPMEIRNFRSAAEEAGMAVALDEGGQACFDDLAADDFEFPRTVRLIHRRTAQDHYRQDDCRCERCQAFDQRQRA